MRPPIGFPTIGRALPKGGASDALGTPASTRIDPRPVLDLGPLRLRRCRHGLMLYPVNDAYVGRSLDRYGEFSEAELRLLAPLLPAGAVVVDAGANVGTHTLAFAKHAGSAGLVLAFEPQRVLHQLLGANLALNGLRNADARRAAVGRSRGEVRVPVLDLEATQNLGGLALGGFTEGDRVPVVAVDDLELPRLDLLKADVEGMEADVIRGAAETILRCRPALYLEDDRVERSAELIELLLSLGYAVFRHLPPLFDPGNVLGEAEDVFGGVVSSNLLGVHPSAGHTVRGLPRVTSPADAFDPREFRSTGG